MIPLNVSFGIFAFLPQGWIFMFFVICLESIITSLLLRNTWNNRLVYKTVILSNALSGIAGFAMSLALNGGWWLVIWFPWVSDNEVDITSRESLSHLGLYYLAAFILTLLIEGLINYLCLRKSVAPVKILKATLLVNILSYIVGSVVLYAYSFGII